MSTSRTTDPDDTVWLLDPSLSVRLTETRALLLENGLTIHRIINSTVVDVAAKLFRQATGKVELPGQLDTPEASVAAELMKALETLGFAVRHPSDEQATRALDTYFDMRRRASRTLSLEEYVSLLGRTRVAVVGHGAVSAAILEAVENLGVYVSSSTTQSQTKADLIIVVSEGDYARSIDQFNMARLELDDGTPWLLVQPSDGARALVGPMIVPGTTACAMCYSLRRTSNFPDDAVSKDLEKATLLTRGPASSANSFSHRFTVGMISQIVLDFAVDAFDGATSAPGILFALTTTRAELSVTTHKVLRVPRCPSCSPARGTGSPQIWFPAPAEESDG
ncbi:TOMM precursor leader peptide-binding protein [Kocuria sp.]|uniref:TOMM precursor leader peptide-binding protein n=1 Tax=Kocuria sp. TaxID=1871328 RepID=UPI0026E0958B|nr:TOMM precursor leader peptide-binding protein [Kocuria sp.]MDO5619152.1 TOMM precursor leader peptide-binding protein [Kocuria sp.]